MNDNTPYLGMLGVALFIISIFSLVLMQEWKYTITLFIVGIILMTVSHYVE